MVESGMEPPNDYILLINNEFVKMFVTKTA